MKNKSGIKDASSLKPKRRKSFFSLRQTAESSSDEDYGYDEHDSDDGIISRHTNDDDIKIDSNQDMEQYNSHGTNDEINVKLPLVEQKNANGETLLYIAAHNGFENVKKESHIDFGHCYSLLDLTETQLEVAKERVVLNLAICSW